MSSKDEILKAIRAQAVPPAPLPDLNGGWIEYADRFAQFQSVIEAVGGRCVRLPDVAAIGPYLASKPEFAPGMPSVSAVPGVSATIDLNAVDDPHSLAPVEWAVLPGLLGVAENGAVWVTDEGLRQRVIFFITQHLALVLPASAIVSNMHEAYQRIEVGKSSLGAFISGPSKTADIEQSLVIGAHGPRSLTVVCVGEEP